MILMHILIKNSTFKDQKDGVLRGECYVEQLYSTYSYRLFKFSKIFIAT
jgi:hypothetical protein